MSPSQQRCLIYPGLCRRAFNCARTLVYRRHGKEDHAQQQQKQEEENQTQANTQRIAVCGAVGSARCERCGAVGCGLGSVVGAL